MIISQTEVSTTGNKVSTTRGGGPMYESDEFLVVDTSVCKIQTPSFGTFFTYQCTLWEPDTHVFSSFDVDATHAAGLPRLEIRETKQRKGKCDGVRCEIYYP